MNLISNIRYSLRQFRHSPIFTAAAVLTLALGIGGTTAIFSLIHSVMLKSLPVADPATLYRVGTGSDCCVEGGPQDEWGMFSYRLYETLKKNLPEFEQVTAFQAGGWRMSVRRENEQLARSLRTEFATGSYFSTFGVGAFGGRVFTEADDQPTAAPVIVLSYHAWQTNYGGDPHIAGSNLVIDGHPFTVAGIAPPGFFGETLRGDPTDLWIPLQQEPLLRNGNALLKVPNAAWLRVIGRLKPGATTSAIGPRLTGILREWLVTDSGYPPDWMNDVKRLLPRQQIKVVPAGAGVADMKENYGKSLQILLAVCGLVLLIACANVANLMLARSASRRGQTAVRMAIGASRRQIIAQALTESVLLAVMGGIAGLAVAVGASRLLLSLAFAYAHFLPISVAPSLPVLGFAFALSLLTGIIFGTAPAWFATHTHPVEALRSGTRTTQDTGSFARKTLLVVQATLSVVLVAGATMLAHSLNNLENQDFGYAIEDRVMVNLNTPPANYTLDRLNADYRELEDKLKHMPGIESEGLALYNPLTDNWGELVVVEGHPPGKFNENSGSSWTRISTDYMKTIGESIVRGRDFTEADNENTAPVALVNENFVKRFLPNEDPLDKHFGIDLPQYAGTFRIVGVVHDARWQSWGFMRPIRPMFYVPLMQNAKYDNPVVGRVEQQSHYINGIMLKTNIPPGQIEAQITKLLAQVDPNLTIVSVRSMRDQISLVFSQERAVASLAGLFGIIALVLAAVGLYGVTAYQVAQRTNEIGVRMALGADRGRVVNMVLRGAFTRVAIGLVLGVPLAVLAGKLIATQLYGVKMWDPAALGIAAGSLATCAFFAAVIPALRAAGISPIDALRAE